MALKKEEEELVAKLRERSYESKKAILDELFIETYLEPLKEAGDKVVKVGVYDFKRIHKPARKGRNPQTGEEMRIPASKAPVFKAGKHLKEVVNK